MIQANRYTPLVATLLVAPAILFLVLYLRAPQIIFVESPQISTRHLADGTEGLTKQTALHLSKMQKGKSIGGFPGFEPPDDDERYKRKVKDGEYNAQDVNNWVKEINNFLRQIADKNPGMTLAEILQKQGLIAEQVGNFLNALRDAHLAAIGMEHFGVTTETVKTLESLMRQLGVAPW